MSQFFDQASLVMIPSGYKNGKVYSQKPLSTDGELTFSRGSDIEATRVAANGYIQKAKVNLLLQSNSFDTTWTKANATLTGGQSGYDGTSDAWLLQNTTSAITYIVQNPSTSGIVTFSVYAKAGNVNWMRFSTSGFANGSYFNLADGTMGSSAGLVDRTITSVGGGWYRITITHTGTTGMFIFPATADNTLSNTAGNNIYIQDAQVNYGLVAQEYQETTTTSVVSGITNDMPRLDYSGGASCGSLLLEPSRTNLVTSTEYLEFGWSLANNATISYESVTAPDGSGLVTKIQATTGDTSGRNQDSLGTLGTNYMFSGFFKGTGVATRLRFRNNQGEGLFYDIDADGNFTLYNTATANHGIDDFPNGWKRIWFETTTSGATTNYIQTYPDTNNGTGSVYAWGIQAEEGSYVTSYIPCNGTSNTRTGESCSKTGISSLIGSAAGTIYVEANAAVLSQMPISSEHRITMVSDNTNNNRILLNFDVTSGGLRRISMTLISGNVAQATLTFNTSVDKVYKIAVAYNTNDFSLFVDGVERATDTSGSTFSGTTLSRLDVGQDRAGTLQQSNPIKQALLFPTRLSNADLATLTA